MTTNYNKKHHLQFFKDHDLIEDNSKIISNGHYYPTKEFNTRDISEGFLIYEKLDFYLCCDEFYPDFGEKDPPDFPFAKNEEDFRNAVNDIFPQIQKY